MRTYSSRTGPVPDLARHIHRLSSTVAGLIPEVIVASLNRLPGADIILMAPRAAQTVIDVQHPDRHHMTRIDSITVRTVGEALIDELALSIMKGNQAMGARPAVVKAKEDAEQVVALIDSGRIDPRPQAFHAAPDAPKRVDRRGTVGFPGTKATHVSFRSGFEVPPFVPRAEAWQAWKANQIVHAYVLEHDIDAPWLINIHGFKQGGPRDLFPFRSEDLRDRHGINVVHPVLPFHGVRREKDAPLMPSVDFVVNVFGLSQSVWDLRRTIRWIRQRSEAPIIVHGVSLGGYVASLLAGLEDTIDAVIVGIPVIDFPSVIRGHAVRMARPADDLDLLNSPAIDRFHELVSPLAIVPKVPVGRRYIYAGKLDQISSPDQAMALWEHWDSPSIHWYDGGHVGGALWDRGVKAFIESAIDESIGISRAAA